jgi:acetyl-CoA carboxylase biotin carboxylase subunit
MKKILIANRGEIACRIIRACKELSIRTLVIYSDVDKNSLHVRKADEAVYIGHSPPLQSYLNIGAIIKAAKENSCDAIHPGYGFLAENYLFAQHCNNENIVFIGPNPESMRLLGSKIDSRITMDKVGIPLIPGMKESSKDINKLREKAEGIGYPVIIKASAGGGGKGMKVVDSPKDLEAQIESSLRESLAAFNSDEIYIEKYIESPRHIEFQIAADNFGRTIHLFERECSIQRRHQKIIEESPSVFLDSNLRGKMADAAIKVIKTANYNNLGTVEFIVDKNGNFYFLEVNARIQVEHPVTEMITGLDLVKLQIQIANGEKLSYSQDSIIQRGHAMECRIYAEDYENNFLPSPGKIMFLQEPSGPGVRYDSGIYNGCDVPIHYDPILAKLITFGSNREEARIRMILALNENVILGVKTPNKFLIKVLEHPEFIKGNLSTDFLEKNINVNDFDKEKNLNIAAACASLFLKNDQRENLFLSKSEITSPWTSVGAWEIGSR